MGVKSRSAPQTSEVRTLRGEIWKTLTVRKLGGHARSAERYDSAASKLDSAATPVRDGRPIALSIMSGDCKSPARSILAPLAALTCCAPQRRVRVPLLKSYTTSTTQAITCITPCGPISHK